MIKYSALGMHLQLNQVVMAGSHDAGITKGAGNVRTQSLNIYDQAAAGVRIFDLRVGAQGKGDHGSGQEATMKAYHAALNVKTKATRVISDLATKNKGVTQMTILPGMGDFGMGLTKMLQDARKFVERNRDEFLILKFDKCSNWTAIAQACVRYLDTAIYASRGNLNTKTLREVAGKVIVVFTPEGLVEVGTAKGYGPALGINGISRVSTDHPYDPLYEGIQYCGKGGTKVSNFFGDKIKENIATQSTYLKEGAAGNPDVMGMMYWTTTGLFESIKQRNKSMWKDKKVNALRTLWEGGLAESIQSRLSSNINPKDYSSGGLLKTFMPNFVMIDFADEDKCRTIFDLNTLASTQLTEAAKLVDQHVKLVGAASPARTGRPAVRR